MKKINIAALISLVLILCSFVCKDPFEDSKTLFYPLKNNTTVAYNATSEIFDSNSP